MSLARRTALALLLALAILAAYGRTLGRGYTWVFDDWKLVVENEAIRDLGNIPRILAATFKNEPVEARDHWIDPGYRPVRMISYAVDHRLFGLDPRGFRGTNILLHFLNALLVASIARFFVSPRAAWAVAFLFALHPLATEAVTYISGRRDVLFAFLYLAALRIHLAKGGAWRGPAVFALYLLALNAKEMAISLPLACLGADLALGGAAAARARWKRHAALLAATLAAAAFIVIVKNPGSLHGEAVARIGGGAWACALTMGRVVWLYLELAIFPATLSADYSFDAISASSGLLHPASSLLALLALLAAAFAIARAWRAGARVEAFLGGFFFVSLGPVSQVLVPHPEPIAERYLYLPLVFLLLLAARVLALSAMLRKAFPAALAVLLVAAGARTFVRNGDWRDDETLFRAAVAAYPRCARANLAYAKALLASTPPRAEEALEHLDRCIATIPEAAWDTRRRGVLVTALFERGTARTALGRWEGALEDLDRVLAERTEAGEAIGDLPQYVYVHKNRAAALGGRGELEKARQEYGVVLGLLDRLDLRDEKTREKAAEARIDTLLQLGDIAFKSDDRAEGVRRLREAAGEAPSERTRGAWFVLGDALLQMGDPKAAEETFTRVAEALDGKEAWYLVAKARDRRSDLAGARAALLRALDADPRFAAATYTLANNALVQGDLDEAERWARATLAAAPGDRRTALIVADIGLKRATASKPPAAKEGERAKPAISRRERAERYFALAEQAYAQKRWEGAIAALEGAVEVDPSFAPGWESLGRLRHKIRAPGALEALREAVRLEPLRTGALETLARFEVEDGVLFTAVEDARQAIEAGRGSPGEARRYGLLALALESTGAAEDAARARATARAVAGAEADALLGGAARALARFDFAAARVAVEAARAELAEAEPPR